MSFGKVPSISAASAGEAKWDGLAGEDFAAGLSGVREVWEDYDLWVKRWSSFLSRTS